MKTLDKNKLLMDITTRQQMYIEGVKLGERKKFDKVLRELSDEFKDLLHSVKYNTLDEMSKVELNVLLVKIRKFQQRIYSKYTEDIVKQLEKFMKVNTNQTKRLMAYAKIQFKFDDFDESLEPLSNTKANNVIEKEKEENNFIPIFGSLPIDGSDEGFNKFWKLMLASPLPANGVMLKDFINAFSVSAQASIENLIRQGYVNGWTIRETLAQLVGTTSGERGQIQRISTQNDSVMSTAFQFVAAMSGSAVSSAVFGRYIWLSVMDNRTTVICRSRNLKIYVYGVGPLPPAHIRCRSHTMPLEGSINLDDRNDFKFYNWASRQPLRFLISVYGVAMANAIKNGTAKESDFDEFTAVEPLDLEEYGGMDDLILLH